MDFFSKEALEKFSNYFQKTRAIYEKFEDSELKNKLIKDLDNFEEKYNSCFVRYLNAELDFVKGNCSKGKLEEISREMIISFVDFGKSFVSDIRAKAKDNLEKANEKFWKYRQN